nr:putative RNA-directed DNA polymerase [Ipomoea batatas]
MFPQASVQNLDVITYDHTTIYVELDGPKHAKRRRRFLFENAWLKDNGCKEIVLGSWNASSDVAVHGFWRKLWRLKIPPNIRNFLWRCIHNVLPTKGALVRRGVDLDNACPLCSQASESLHHLLFVCPQVSDLWIDLMRPMDDSVVFAMWLDDVITAGPMVKVLRCVANCWCIWRGRNDLVWGGKSWQPLQIKNEVSHLLESWKCMMSTAVMVNAQSMQSDSNFCQMGTAIVRLSKAILTD